jgi:hypothetical protein
MQPEGQVMTWDAFKTKFRKAHVPSGLIKIMRDKFLNLKQGDMSVTDYLDKFTTWGGMPQTILIPMRRRV